MEKKIGLYICTGCKIGASLDIEALSSLVRDEYKIPICKTHDFLCSKEGIDLIKKDITEEGVNAVVIAACSSRAKYDVFEFGNEVLLNRVDLREQVIWSHPANDEDTQMLAEDNLRMGIVRVQKMDLVEPYQAENLLVKSILVVGGGLAGMTAALEASKANYDVV
ncbi:MAG: FAD-binding protein, partial [Deltaproteobacteria bacterium]|nr:FAD-binding protein [Deltaproteobacteria bacterium]